MMKEENNIEWNLIVRKILGTVTQEEERLFKTWYDSDKKNQDYYQKASAYFERYYTGNEERKVDKMNAWNEFLKYTNKQKNSLNIRLLKYAAAIAIPLMCSWLTYTFISDINKDSQEIARQEILPGETKAILVLGNGKEIYLTGIINQDTLAQEKNVTINQSDNGLLYNIKNVSEQHNVTTNMIITPRGGEYQVTLSDGTRITLNAESKLVYPVEFPDNLRKVQLTGEAYFEVAHNESAPFVVETQAGQIKVLGTIFNVSAYTNDDIVQTTLLTGSISFTTPGKVTNEQVIMPGEQITYNKADQTTLVQKVNTGIFCGWRDGKFIVEDKRLEDIMKQLARWYDVEVFFQNEEAKNLVFTGDLEKYEKCDVILNFIQLSTRVDFVLKGRTITVKMRH